jgi:arsenite methyltransferase
VSTEPATIARLLAGGEVKACCAAAYEHPLIRWLLGGELHPGGEATTLRSLELLGIGPGERLLDVASGSGASARLAARERGCEVVGVDYGEATVAGARAAAASPADRPDPAPSPADRPDPAPSPADRPDPAPSPPDRVSFVVGDAESLPLADSEFDAVLCECSLCVFPDKPRAVAEMARVLRAGGRVAISDVVADRARLPAGLRGTMATVACVGDALDEAGYRRLLEWAGFEVVAVESRDADAAALAERVRDRLRGARIVAAGQLAALPGGIDAAIELAGVARDAIADGTLGYSIFIARFAQATA